MRLWLFPYIFIVMKMRKFNFILILLAIAVAQIIASATLVMFNAHSEGENITLTWQTAEENGVKEFVIQRRTIDGAFFDIDKVKARGSNSFYTYTDEDVFSKENYLYVYRLKMVDYNPNVPPTYSNEVSVSHNVSSVKRTWGSIKALFR